MLEQLVLCKTSDLKVRTFLFWPRTFQKGNMTHGCMDPMAMQRAAMSALQGTPGAGV